MRTRTWKNATMELPLELPSFDWGSIVKQKKLGSGSFGCVHLTRHGSSSQNVFIKKRKSMSFGLQIRFVRGQDFE